MDKELTEIIVIVDRSASMGAVKGEAILGFNDFLKKQQESKDGRCLLTYCQFNTDYEIIHNGVPVEDVPPLTEETFVPAGWTALHDAVCRTIDEVGERLSKTPEEKRPADVTVVILTDGQENSSREYNASHTRQKVKHQTDKYNWSFVFLGQNIDAFHAGNMLGLDMNHHQHFVGQVKPGGQGQVTAYSAAADAMVMKRHRVVRGMSANFTEADKASYTAALGGTGSTSLDDLLVGGTGETDSGAVLSSGTGDAD